MDINRVNETMNTLVAKEIQSKEHIRSVENPKVTRP